MRKHLGMALVIAALTVPLGGCVVRFHDEPHRYRHHDWDRDRDRREERAYGGHFDQQRPGDEAFQRMSQRDGDGYGR